jgi:hypothetical protein
MRYVSRISSRTASALALSTATAQLPINSLSQRRGRAAAQRAHALCVTRRARAGHRERGVSREAKGEN